MRTPLAKTEDASLSQQIRVGGGEKCPEEFSENEFLADRRKNRDIQGDLHIHLAQAQRVQPNIALLPEPPRQSRGSPLVRYIYVGSTHY